MTNLVTIIHDKNYQGMVNSDCLSISWFAIFDATGEAVHFVLL
jgi:hypothetical protein